MMFRRILFSVIAASLALTSTLAQDAVAVAEQTDMTKTDKNLGEKAVATFIAKSNNLVISSSNHTDKVGTATKQSDGTYVTTVECDLSDKSVERQRTFTVLIKNTSLKGSIVKKMVPGKRFFFKATEASHMLNFWWPNTRNTLYAVAGKACVEFQIPANINDLKLKYSNGIGGKVSTRTEAGLNILSLEVDCNQLKNFIENIELKKQAADAAEKAYNKQKEDIDANLGTAGYDLDAAEKREKELEQALEQAQGAIPQLYIILYGDNSNEVELDVEKIKSTLVNPKNKLTVGVNDNLQKEVVGTTPLAEKLRTANNAYESRKFKEAKTAYEQAMNEKEATEADKAVCQGWIETISQCIEAQNASNDALLLLKRFKEKGTDVNPESVIELYDVVIANYNTLYNLTHNNYYINMVEKVTTARSRIPIIVSGTTVATRLRGGIYEETPITNVEIFAIPLNNRGDRDKVGEVDANGKFKIELKRDVYSALMFVQKGGRSVYQSLEGNKHLGISVSFKGN